MLLLKEGTANNGWVGNNIYIERAKRGTFSVKGKAKSMYASYGLLTILEKTKCTKIVDRVVSGCAQSLFLLLIIM